MNWPAGIKFVSTLTPAHAAHCVCGSVTGVRRPVVLQYPPGALVRLSHKWTFLSGGQLTTYVGDVVTSLVWNAVTLAVALGETRPVQFPGGDTGPLVFVILLTCSAWLMPLILARYVQAPDHASALSLTDIALRFTWAAFFVSVNIWIGAALKLADAARGIAALSR